METPRCFRTESDSSTAAIGSALSPVSTPSALAALVARTMVAIVSSLGLASAQVGTNYCSPAPPNSTGLSAHISANGSSNLSVNNNRLTLRADDLPQGVFGFFLASRTQGFVAQPGGSTGNLCLGGTLGRYVGPFQVMNSGAAGSLVLEVNLALTPEGGGFAQVAPGDTWNFQAWYRIPAPPGTLASNFSDGLEVMFHGGGGGMPVAGMVPIPAGTFMMGSNAPSGAPYFNDSLQQPVHQVTISYSFWMGRHEVTQALYQGLMGVNPAFYVGASRPVERVSWHDARAYCAALTTQMASSVPAGYEFRLPTEAEWEYACRAGTTTEFHFGPTIFCTQASIGFNYHSSPPATCSTSAGTLSVGSFPQNPFGLHDMHGNVWEWCLDSLEAYNPASVTDPFVTGGTVRVIRGGGWDIYSGGCRSAFRNDGSPNESFSFVGFRPVLAPILVP